MEEMYDGVRPTRPAPSPSRRSPGRRNGGEGGWEPLLRHLLGLVAACAVPADVAEARQHLESALATATRYGRRPLAAGCHLGLGELYRLAGQREGAQHHLATAMTMFREMRMTYWRGKAESEMRDLACSGTCGRIRSW